MDNKEQYLVQIILESVFDSKELQGMGWLENSTNTKLVALFDFPVQIDYSIFRI